VSAAAILAAVLLTACAGDPAPEGSEVDLDRLLPVASELEGWGVAEGPTAHGPETLFEYMNGGAERYLSHGFRRLLHVRYQLGEDPLASVTLDLYDMGSELGAFGIYSAGRWPEVEARPWGAEGYRFGTIAAAWKGRVFVHGQADDERPELAAMLETLVARAADGAPGEPSPPAILAVLPAEGLVARSERYVPSHLLGHAFLPGGVSATYEIDGRRAVLYYADLGTEEAAAEALEALRSHLQRRGEVGEPLGTPGAGGFRFTAPTLGSGSVVRTGSHVVGGHGELSAREREALLALLARALP
jgi:hypothetical protein